MATNTGAAIVPWIIVIIFLIILFSMSVRVLAEYQRGVVFRLGRLVGAGAGDVLLIPFVDRMVQVDLRVVTLEVPPQDVITKDNVTVKVSAVVYFRVVNRPVIGGEGR